MGGIEKEFRAAKGDTIIRGAIWVEGAPNGQDLEWADALEAAIYERVHELETASTPDEMGDSY
jgi:hypothetical protein